MREYVYVGRTIRLGQVIDEGLVKVDVVQIRVQLKQNGRRIPDNEICSPRKMPSRFASYLRR